MLGNDRSVTRFAGQVGDITQFMPKSGRLYEKQAIEAMNADNVRRIGGIKSAQAQSLAGVKGVTTAQLGNLKGKMLVTQGKLKANQAISAAKAGAARTNAQGDINQFSGILSGITGLAKGGLGFADAKGWFDKKPTNKTPTEDDTRSAFDAGYFTGFN